MFIDAHHHLWQYNDRNYIWMSGGMTALRPNFLFPELEAVLHENCVDGSVAVQAGQTARQIFILDHIAKPRIRENLLAPWKQNITELAKRDNVYCKVSGMATEADWTTWTADQLRPYFDVVLSAFGPRRLMFGSDWPVLTLAGSYRRWVDTFHSFIAELSPDEREDISSRTAMAAYCLQP